MPDVMDMWGAEAARMMAPVKRTKSDPSRGVSMIRQNRCAFCHTIVTVQNWCFHDQDCYGTDPAHQRAGGNAASSETHPRAAPLRRGLGGTLLSVFYKASSGIDDLGRPLNGPCRPTTPSEAERTRGL